MRRPGNRTAKTGTTAGVLLAGAVGLLALPSAVLAFSASFEPRDVSRSSDSIDPLGTETDPSKLSVSVPLRSLAKGQLYLFTPAGTPNRPDRSVTVAVRVDAEAAKAISAIHKSALEADGALRIAPTAFNLGVSRGYRNFSQELALSTEKSNAPISDLERFSISPGTKSGESRFSPRIVVDETQGAGRAPRTFAGDSDDLVDVGGSYRLTDNLDVTAGVRYLQERERLLPLTDGKQDNQAVYVGTQFRF